MIKLLRHALSFAVLMVFCVFGMAATAEDDIIEHLDIPVAFPANPVRLPTLLTDGAVLQRDRPIPVWGWGEPYKTITVQVADSVTSGEVGVYGLWSVELPGLKAGGPYTLTAGDSLTTATAEDVYIGDVWLAGGQSNMAQTLAGTANASTDVPLANLPRLRLFQVPRSMGYSPQNDFPAGAKWTLCTPETAARFSAIGYYFGRNLHEHLDVPVGIIEATWVNTMTSFWLSPAAVSNIGYYEHHRRNLHRTSTHPARARKDDDLRWADWMMHLHEDADGSTGTLPWYSPHLKLDKRWKRMQMPDIWERGGLGLYDGTVWFRRDFEVPDAWEGLGATLRLNRVLDSDVTWINGEKVGSGDDQSTTRVYTLPPGMLKPGKNNLTMRIVDIHLWGGLSATSPTLCIEAETDDGSTSIPLGGEWRVRPALALHKARPRPYKSTEEWPHPSNMYNAMIAPLVAYAIRGVVWYQGEADMTRAHLYRHLLLALIRDWRDRWKQPDMPFIFAQIGSEGRRPTKPETSLLAELRDSQQWVADRTTSTAMVPMYDLAQTTEGHFLRKHLAAQRLTSAALTISYGEEHPYQGPRYKMGSFKRQKNGRVRLSFESSGPLVVAKGYDSDVLPGFTIAGSDEKFTTATARLIDDNTIEVWSPKIKRPAAVRFAWANRPWTPLYDSNGLPLEQFRTDKWSLATEGMW